MKMKEYPMAHFTRIPGIICGCLIGLAPAAVSAGEAEYNCYLKGLQAAQDSDPTYDRRVQDQCGPDNSEKRKAWVAGAYDRDYDSAHANKWYSVTSDSGSNSVPTGAYVANWYAWGHVGQTISGCPSGYPNLSRGQCYQDCENGYYPFHLTRGDVCVSCPSGGNSVELQGDGQVYCYP